MRVLIGEDEALLRAGLSLVLAQHGVEILGSSGDADELVVMAGHLMPDLVLTDIRMPPTRTDDGLRAALQIALRVRRPPWSCSPSSSSGGTPWSCWPTGAAGWATS